MPVIPEREQRIIQERFAAELAGRVRIDYFTQHRSPIVVPGRAECRHCEEVGQALVEVAALHSRMALTAHDFAEGQADAEKLGVKRVPCTVIRGQANRALRYYGLPGGHQFANLIETIIMSSRADVTIGHDALVALKKLREAVRVSVFVTPACEYSAVVANMAFRMALSQANVKAEVVEIGEFPELVQRFAVTATPTTVIDGRTSIRGLIDETELATQIVRSVESETTPASIDAGPATPFETEPPTQPATIADPAAPRIYIPGR
jgi:glutaredoxin-like protein